MTIRLLNRCIQITKLNYQPAYRYLRGGQATVWPWRQVRIGRIEVTVSRIRPRKRPEITRT